MKNVLKSLAKSVLVPLGLTAAASALDAAIHKKMFESGCPSDLTSRTATLIVSNEEMNIIMEIVKSLKESGLVIKGVSETIQNEAKKQNGRFLSMLLGTLLVGLSGNLLIGKGRITAGEGTIRAGKVTIRPGQDF